MSSVHQSGTLAIDSKLRYLPSTLVDSNNNDGAGPTTPRASCPIHPVVSSDAYQGLVPREPHMPGVNAKPHNHQLGVCCSPVHPGIDAI